MSHSNPACDRRRFIGGLIGAVAVPAAARKALANSPAHLTLGLLPNLSARVLLNQYAPLKQYLDRTLDAAIELVTAPDMGAFQRRTLAGDYDIVVTAAHLGRHAELDARWAPVAIYEPAIKGLLVVRKDSKVTAVGGFRGTQITFANPLSLVAVRGREWLVNEGLQPGRDVELVTVRRDDSIGNVLQRNEVAGAILSGGEFRAIPEAQRSDLRILTTFAEVPGFLVLTNPKLAPSRTAAIAAALTRFAESPVEATQFAERSGFTRIRAPQPEELRGLDPLMAETRRLLAAA